MELVGAYLGSRGHHIQQRPVGTVADWMIAYKEAPELMFDLLFMDEYEKDMFVWELHTKGEVNLGYCMIKNKEEVIKPIEVRICEVSEVHKEMPKHLQLLSQRTRTGERALI